MDSDCGTIGPSQAPNNRHANQRNRPSRGFGRGRGRGRGDLRPRFNNDRSQGIESTQGLPEGGQDHRLGVQSITDSTQRNPSSTDPAGHFTLFVNHKREPQIPSNLDTTVNDNRRSNHSRHRRPIQNRFQNRNKHREAHVVAGTSKQNLGHHGTEERLQNDATNNLNPQEQTEKPTYHRRFIRERNGPSLETKDKPAVIQSEISENHLNSNTFECMICCDNIHRTNPIWYCINCYNIFHMKCAIEWCNKSIKSRNEAIENAQYPSLGGPTNSRLLTNSQIANVNADSSPSAGYSNYQNERMNSIEWPCPACREVLHARPGKYKCFCGKVTRPEINRHLTPHSCGQMCGRKRPNSDCPHTCNNICHPGRCNNCQLTSKKACYCGKVIQEIKCSVGVQSCDNICEKTLNCGRHKCSSICHSGCCKPCEEYIEISCYCGDKKLLERCHEVEIDSKLSKGFSCEKVCDKLLDCGNHQCNQKCHPNPNCRSCELLSENIKTCPCGSTLIKKSVLTERKSCTDPIPTCENKCNRSLICGPEKNRHRCQKKCHIGLCPPCKLKTTARCECTLSTKTVDCVKMFKKIEDGHQIYFKQTGYSFTCETRCNKPKNCGRHRCQNKCCKAYKVNNADLHKCDQICNRKLPCGLHNCSEPCHNGQCGDCTNIGWEELACHCGASVMYPPIPCGARPPACHRTCRRPHACGHPVKHECHDDKEKCAPCTVFVKKSCFCEAESKDTVHCYQPGYSCGRTCKKQLSCRQHTCKRVCHDSECETPNHRGVIVCSQPCPVLRFGCKHPCSLSCHGKTPCPTSECKKTMEIFCECGNRAERIECYKLMKDVDNRNKVAMLSMNRPNQDSVIIDLSRKLTTSANNQAATSTSLTQKTLDCDESCAILKRNKALAEALEIAQPDLKPASVFGEDPLRLLKDATAHDYKFVAATYNSLAKFIKTAREADRRFIFMKFPPANKLRREVIHELAHHFNCTSESDGDEPFRHVVVRAYKNKSSVPEFNIEQLLPISD